MKKGQNVNYSKGYFQGDNTLFDYRQDNKTKLQAKNLKRRSKRKKK